MKLAYVVVAVFLAGNRPASSGGQPSLRFSDYPAPTATSARAKDVNVNDPFVRHFRTLLREALAEGPDFAGHYRVVTISGGTNLVTVFLLDTATGRLLAPAALESLFFPYPESNAASARYGIETRLTSRLLVVRGVPAAVESLGTFYFEFDGTDLRLVRGFRWRSRFNGNIPPQ